MRGVTHTFEHCDKLISDILSLQVKYGNVLEDFTKEGDVLNDVIKIRHGRNPTLSEYSTKGSVFIRQATSADNESKFSRMWADIIYMNKKNVDADVIIKYDDRINELIDFDDKDPLWCDLYSNWFDPEYDGEANADSEQIRTQILPKFRCASKEYYKSRLHEQIQKSDNTRLAESNQNSQRKAPVLGSSNKGKSAGSKPLLEHMGSRDRSIYLPYDLMPTGKSVRKLSRYLIDRMNMELNPNYPTHPIMLMYLTICFLKTRRSNYFSYGIRYLELYMTRLPVEDAEYHMPFEFRSNGEFVSIHYHSHVTFRFKFILNSLSNLYMNESIHNFDSEYTDLMDELTLYMLYDVNERGKTLKRLFSIINLYYGMNCKPPNSDNDFKAYISPDTIYNDRHIHPSYPTQTFVDSWMLQDVAYVPVVDCSMCLVTNADRGVFTKEVRDELKLSFDEMHKNGLDKLVKHCVDKLLYRRPHAGIISDLIFVRMIINSGGYAHTHKILDFDQIDKNYKLNELNMQKDTYTKTYEWLGNRMRRIGKAQTLRLIDASKYHSDIEFKNRLSRYTTARNSGLPPIDVSIHSIRKNKSNHGHIKRAKFASKNAFLMLRGRDALDLLNVNKSDVNLLTKVRANLIRPSHGAVYSNKEMNTICREYGISNIGSRSTTAFRDVRAIFNNATTAHFAQAALIHPHIEETTYKPTVKPGGIFIGTDYGSCIATQFMDGTTDLVAPAVMSSANGQNVSVLSDCSQWDQTFNSADSMEFYYGVQEAISERFSLFKDRAYMYQGSQGVNLHQLASWFNDYHRFRWFKAEYAGELKVYKTNFMWSGRLDTFFLNCVQNECYNKEIDSRIVRELRIKGFKFLTIAGDDVAAVLDAEKWNARMTELLKDIVVDTYTSGGKVINRIKSAVVARGGEYAKIYWYFGMVFRDPSIQMFESEKIQRTSTQIEYLRGYAQKLFEYQRRAKTSMRQSSLFSRFILGLSYYLDTMVVEGSRKIKIRYVPPVQACYIPTFIEGGLGFSLSGLTLNESLFIRKHLNDYIFEASNTLSRMKSVMVSDVANTILNMYLNEEQLNTLKVDTMNTKGLRIEYESNDPEITNVDFLRGLDHRRNELDPIRVKASNDAISKLKNSADVSINKKMTYSFSSYTNFYDSVSSMVVDRSATSQALSYNVSRMLSYRDGEVSFQKSAGRKSFSSMLKLYKPFTFTLVNPTYKRNQSNVQQSYRYVSVPNEGIQFEQMFGSRYGKASLNRLKGFQHKIRKFIKDVQLPMTEIEVIKTITDSGVLNSSNVGDLLTDVLTAISGDRDASYALAMDISTNDTSWSEEIASVNIIGTILENIHINDDTVDARVTVRCDSVLPLQFLRMIKYSAFVYLLQEMIYTGNFSASVDVGTTIAMADLIRSIKPFKNFFSYADGISSFEELMVSSNLGAVFGNHFIDDMSL